MHVLNGHFEGRKLVLDDPVPEDLPENAKVKITVESPAQPPSLAEAMKEFIGMGNDMPKDGSKNVDHYLYGAPRK